MTFIMTGESNYPEWFTPSLKYLSMKKELLGQFPDEEIPALLSQVSNIVDLTVLRLAFLWDMNSPKWCNGFYIEFRQSFTEDTFFYDEHLKS